MNLGLARFQKQEVETKNKKVDKVEFIKTKNFCAVNDNIKKMKHQFAEWRKRFTSHIPHKELVSRLHKEF